MEASIKKLDITGIQFESNDSEVLIKGNMSYGHLSHPTDILVSQTQLNKVINQLNKQNNNFEFDKFITAEPMYNNETLYTVLFNSKVNTSLFLHEILNTQSYIEICA